MSINCPKCRTEEMKVEVHEGIEIERCPVCQGIFLDKGELVDLLSKNVSNDVDSLSFTALSEVMNSIPAVCGRCEGERMDAVESHGGIRVDLCKKCGGIFLDQGELASLQLNIS